MLSIITLMSCTIGNLPSNKTYNLKELNENEGIAVGCFSMDSKDHFITKTRYDLYFNAVNQPIPNEIKEIKKNSITITPPGMVSKSKKSDLLENGYYNYYFIVKNIAGEYKFFLLGTEYPQQVYGKFLEMIKMNIPFKIEKGKAKYIGNIRFSIEYKNKTNEDSSNYDYSFQLLDNFERDKVHIKMIYPDIEVQK